MNTNEILDLRPRFEASPSSSISFAFGKYIKASLS